MSIAGEPFAEVASHLAGELDAAGNCRTSVAGPGAVAGSAASADVRIVRAAELPADGYRLTVGQDGVELAAAEPAGAFHGAQTLLQLVSGATRRRVPAVRIVDRPRFRVARRHAGLRPPLLPRRRRSSASSTWRRASS